MMVIPYAVGEAFFFLGEAGYNRLKKKCLGEPCVPLASHQTQLLLINTFNCLSASVRQDTNQLMWNRALLFSPRCGC